MMKIGLLISCLIWVSCSSGSSSPSPGSPGAFSGKFTPLFPDPSGVTRLVKTLTTESPAFSIAYNKNTVGFVYTPACSNFSGTPLPLSYWTSVDYFGDYAYQIYYSNSTGAQVPALGQGGSSYSPNQKLLSVTDTFSGSNYTVVPTYSNEDPSGAAASGGANLQYERINTANGTDIYDAACYQIALALAAKYKVSTSVDLKKYINGPNLSLSVNKFKGANGNDSNCGSAGGNRATTQVITGDSRFYYGGCAANGSNSGSAACTTGFPTGAEISTPQDAYYFRMITQQWTSADPFFTAPCQECYNKFSTCTKTSTECQSNLTTCYDKNLCLYSKFVQPVSSQYFPGAITWADYKPITGENVWGLLLGPMTAVNILNESLETSDPRYLTAKGFLVALKAMQSKCSGAFYYVAQGSLGNTGSTAVNPFEVSTENNASALGGLLAFKKALLHMNPKDPDRLIPQIDSMVWGPGGNAKNPVQPSVLAYFKERSWDTATGFFKQGITESYDSTGACTVTYNTGANAVDVNTWGIATLSPGLLDTWFGAGTAYQNWQKIKVWGGYYDPNTNNLLGVGYSDLDNNGSGKKGGIMSAEWSFGAINFVRSLIAHYGTSRYPDLVADEKALVQGVMQLHSDNYADSPAFAVVNNDITTGRPAKYKTYVPTTTSSSPGGWFIYASKRYFIPFGWFANPLPSLTSTSWGVMTQYEYNPFNPDGGYSDWWQNP